MPADYPPDKGLDYHSVAVRELERRGAAVTLIDGEHAMSKSQDAKKNVKKAPSKTPKEKKEAKRLKKAEKKH
jgi:hypothetical protein